MITAPGDEDADGDRTEWTSGWLAGRGTALALLPVSLWPPDADGTDAADSMAYLGLASLLGAWQLLIAIRFLASRNDRSARRLLRASLIYLPLMLLIFTFLPR